MSLEDTLNSDLKQALLSGDKLKTETLKGVKSALQYAAVSGKAKEQLTDDDMLAVLSKESKKRQEAIEQYQKAGNQQAAEKETAEKAIIDSYLPEQMSEEQINQLVDEIIAAENMQLEPKNMGIIIGKVKNQAGPSADGATIAKVVKERIAA